MENIRVSAPNAIYQTVKNAQRKEKLIKLYNRTTCLVCATNYSWKVGASDNAGSC